MTGWNARDAPTLWPVTPSNRFHEATSKGLKGKDESVRFKFKAAVSGLVATAIASGGLLAFATPAFANPTKPSWEPDTNAATFGNIAFYDANGVQVTSGTDLANPFAYAVATTADTTSGATKSSLFFKNPHNGVVPANWGGSQEGGTTTYTALAAPTPANIIASGTASYPVSAQSAGSDSITAWLGGNTPDTTAGFANTIQVRIQNSPGGNLGNNSAYWETDIGYNTTASPITVDGTTVPANGWAQLFPFVAAPTSTPTLTATDNGSAVSSGATIPPSSAVVLTASNVPTSPAGYVVFENNGTPIADVAVTGSTVTDSFTSSATNSTNSYTASFVPGPPAESGANTATATQTSSATSAPFGLNVVVPKINTTTALSATSNSIAYGGSDTFTATVTEADAPTSTGAAGNVVFFDGASAISGNIATTVSAANCPVSPAQPAGSQCGQAQFSTTTLPQGNNNSITAQFTPTNNGSYNGSTSPAVVVTVAAPAKCGLTGSQCTDVQNVQVTVNPGTITMSTPYTSTNPFILPPMTLSSDGTYLQSSATFPSPPTGSPSTSVSTVPTDPNAADFNGTTDSTLLVASTAGFEPQGTLTVTTMNGSVAATAELTYTGKTTAGVGGATQTSFTGVTYADGSGVITSSSTVSGPASQIVVTSTLAPAQTWGVTVSSTGLVLQTDSTKTIPAQNMGFTGDTWLNQTNPGAYPGTVTMSQIPALNPSSNPADVVGTGPGLSSTPQTFATSTAADGTALMNGTLTVLAPTSTPPGLYTGTITFTVG